MILLLLILLNDKKYFFISVITATHAFARSMPVSVLKLLLMILVGYQNLFFWLQLEN